MAESSGGTEGQDGAGGVWARRLAGGPAFSCAQGWGPGQVLEAFWRDVFAATPQGYRVLEVGCGSADVSVWAAEAGRGLKIVASDLFDSAEGVRTHPDVTFLGGASVEALPAPAASFDMVVSNFAVEYAPNRDAAAAELARVLRPGGRGVLVLHSADSTVTQTSLIALETHAALLAADVPDRVRRAAALRPDHLSRRKLLKDVLRRRGEIPAPMLSFSGVEYFALAERLLKGDPAARQDLARLDEGVAMRMEISREQSGVALDPAALSALTARLRAVGFDVEASEMTCTYDNGATDKVGWIVLLTRRTD